MMGLDPRNKALAVGEHLHGYEVLRQTDVPNLGLVTTELRHLKTGAHHLHLSHPMQENVFMTTLRTLPADNTGVAHILEHSVLEGSENYPVKMFDLMTGRSLNSFMNAFTSPDKTSYPFATPNEDDWHNLLDRYLDAVFHPLLEDEVFLQEGWRHEFDEPENSASPLRLKGVVLNEMKAAMSSPDAQFSRSFRSALFPDLCYQFNSGGDPEAIPELKMKDWRAFYARHYHPANSWTATFGSFPLAATLEKINSSISSFDAMDAAQIPQQPEWSSPKRQEQSFGVPKESSKQSAPITVAMGWRLCSQENLDDLIDLNFLMDVLCGSLTAPLNHCLLSSGLAPALAPTGMNASASQLSFGIGLKGIDEEKIEDFQDLLLGELKRLSQEGLPKEQLESVLDRFELEMREQNRVWGMPWGLALCYFGMSRWMDGYEPTAQLRHDLLLEGLHKRLEDPDYLKKLIARHFVNNTNRLLFVMRPEFGGLERREKEAETKLRNQEAKLSADEKVALVKQAKAVQHFREREQDLSCMPVIDIARLPRVGLDSTSTQQHHPAFHLHESKQATNGLLHVQAVFPLNVEHADSQLYDLLGWLPSLAHAGLGTIGSERRIQSLTSGVGMGSSHTLPVDGVFANHHFRFSFHGLASREKDLMQLLSDLLFEAEFTDEKRLEDLLKMRQSNLRSRVVGQARTLALDGALMRISPLAKRTAAIEGIPFLRHLAQLDVKKDQLASRLSALYKDILDQDGRQIALCGDAITDQTRQYLKDLPFASTQTIAANPLAEAPLGLDDSVHFYTTEVDGAFVAQAFQAPAFTHPDAPFLTLLANCLYQPLQERIRAKGGAYGARASYSMGQRVFSFLSWRDPRVAGTLADYKTCMNLAMKPFSQEVIDRAKVEAISALDAPLLPHELGARSLSRHLSGSTQAMRVLFRQSLLDATPEDILRVAKRWLNETAASRIAVVGGASMALASEVADLDLHVEELLPERSKQS
jgi:presequence protease